MSTAKAEILDPQRIPALKSALSGTPWAQHLLVDEDMFRQIYSDAKGYKSTLEELTKSQRALNVSVNKLNDSNVRIQDLQGSILRLSHENFLLDNPPWYKSAPVWGAVGVAVGVALSVASLAYGGALGS